jgi:hypothetical protein
MSADVTHGNMADHPPRYSVHSERLGSRSFGENEQKAKLWAQLHSMNGGGKCELWEKIAGLPWHRLTTYYQGTAKG